MPINDNLGLMRLKDDKMSRKLLIVDGPNLLMRSVHAMKAANSFTNQGAYTGPLVLFVKVLGHQIRVLSPSAVVVCWEGGNDFRKEEFKDYKSNRPQEVHPLRDISFELTHMFLSLNGISQVAIPGFEADDVIAALVHRHSITHQIDILSADKDLLQLIDDNVHQIKLGSGGNPTVTWGIKEVEEKYGCTPDKLPILMALMGDRSDGIPGVPGMGPKKALKALEKHGWDLTTNDHPAIIEYRDDALLSYRLINLRSPERVPDLLGTRIAFMPPKEGCVRYENLIRWLDDYSLNDIKGLLRRGELWEKR